MNFNRIATFFVCEQQDANCNFDDETVAEIIYGSKDGNTLIYTDGTLGVLGFIDITDPAAPAPLGTVDVGGEPTSVVVVGDYALVCVDTSPSFTEPSGIFHVIDIATQTVLRTGDLGGQPDAVALSPDGMYVAIAIENERDEDFNDGLLPQFPAGFLVTMDVSSVDVNEWTLTKIELTGLEGASYPEDPEPEYVDINANNIGKSLSLTNLIDYCVHLASGVSQISPLLPLLVVVTLQENNAIVLIDLATNEIIKSFSAGAVDVDGVDIVENDMIEQTGSLAQVLREPDGCVWIGTEYFATADEGGEWCDPTLTAVWRQ
jgi:hypothetical protein